MSTAALQTLYGFLNFAAATVVVTGKEANVDSVTSERYLCPVHATDDLKRPEVIHFQCWDLLRSNLDQPDEACQSVLSQKL